MPSLPRNPSSSEVSGLLKRSAEKRLRALLLNKYCANCFAHEHNRNHHLLLHMHEHVSRKKSGPHQQPASPQRSRRQDSPTRQTLSPLPRSASSTPASSLAARIQRHSVNVLPTALVIVETAHIDPSTPTSSIDASLASAFCLPTTNVVVCTATIWPNCATCLMVLQLQFVSHVFKIP